MAQPMRVTFELVWTPSGKDAAAFAGLVGELLDLVPEWSTAEAQEIADRVTVLLNKTVELRK